MLRSSYMPGSLEKDNFPTNGGITVSGHRIASHAVFDQQFNNISKSVYKHSLCLHSMTTNQGLETLYPTTTSHCVPSAA